MLRWEDARNYLKLEHNIAFQFLMPYVVLHYAVIYYNVAKFS